MRIAFPVPSWLTLPYIPDRTYATASPIVIRIPSNFCAPFLSKEVTIQLIDIRSMDKQAPQFHMVVHWIDEGYIWNVHKTSTNI